MAPDADHSSSRGRFVQGIEIWRFEDEAEHGAKDESVAS